MSKTCRCHIEGGSAWLNVPDAVGEEVGPQSGRSAATDEKKDFVRKYRLVRMSVDFQIGLVDGAYPDSCFAGR